MASRGARHAALLGTTFIAFWAILSKTPYIVELQIRGATTSTALTRKAQIEKQSSTSPHQETSGHDQANHFGLKTGTSSLFFNEQAVAQHQKLMGRIEKMRQLLSADDLQDNPQQNLQGSHPTMSSKLADSDFVSASEVQSGKLSLSDAVWLGNAQRRQRAMEAQLAAMDAESSHLLAHRQTLEHRLETLEAAERAVRDASSADSATAEATTKAKGQAKPVRRRRRRGEPFGRPGRAVQPGQ